jgi:hypothetical protein
MEIDFDSLTRNGTVSQEIYRIIREAIRVTGEQRGRLFDVGHEAHYQALAVAFGLKAAGYVIEKAPADA